VLRRVTRLVLDAWRWHCDQSDIRSARDTAETAYPEINALFVRIIRKTPVRPAYLWGSLHGAYLAKSLGLGAVSLVEFGVAGGNGLVDLDLIAHAIASNVSVQTSVFGFDSGQGLPAPVDVRDCPNLFSPGDYPMDAGSLRERVHGAELILGDVADTIDAFLARKAPPVAFASFDLDLYSSTAHALRLFEDDPTIVLPRVHCYFDDITGFTYADFNGERLAIHEFNERNGTRKISALYGLSHYVPTRCSRDLWVEKMHLAHILDHPLYGEPDGLTRIARKDLEPAHVRLSRPTNLRAADP
jgi:hypothetical protein